MKKSIFSIKNKNIFISGAYGFISSKLSEQLAKEGANLILNGQDLKKLQNLEKRIKKINSNVKLANFDIAKSSDINNFFKNDYKLPLNSIIHNANYSNTGSLNEISEKDYIKSYEVSVTAAHNLLKYSKPNLLKAVKKYNFASFINIGSIYGSISPYFYNYGNEKYFNPPNYGTSKAALLQWTKYAACQYGKYGIRFNCVSPGPIPNLKNNLNKNFLNKLIKKIPLQTLGKPEDLFGMIIFLSSNSSQFINGSNFIIDGGWSSW